MDTHLLQLVDKDIYTYLVVRKTDFTILAGNKLARDYFSTSGSFQDLQSIFLDDYDETVAQELEKTGYVFLPDLTCVKSTGETFQCDLELYSPNPQDPLLFLVMKDQSSSKDVRLREIVELSHNPAFVLDLNQDYEIRFLSSHLTPLQYKEKTVYAFLDLLPEENVEFFKKSLESQINQWDECNLDVEFGVSRDFSQLYRFNAFLSPVDEKLYGVLVAIKKQSELMRKIEYDQQYFEIMQEFSKDLLFRIDVKNKTLVHRGDISKFVDLRPEVTEFPESIRDLRFVHPEDVEAYIAFSYKLIHGMTASVAPRFQLKTGVFEQYQLQGKPLFDPQGKTVQVVGKCENIQKYVEIEAKALYDPLTATLNKSSFQELVEAQLSRAVERDRFALLFLDIDDFKGINDCLGHLFGDFLLETVGKRIHNCIRSQDRVGRVGGDEFIIFFHYAPSPEAVLERGETILQSLRREFTNGDLKCKVKSSVGVALYPDHGTTYAELYHRADKALYHSKTLGKDVVSLYSPNLPNPF